MKLEPTKILITPMVAADAEIVAELSKQLGYSMSVTETLTHLKAIQTLPDNCLFVAKKDNRVIGWIHAFVAIRIESKPFVEIGGLVVDEACKGMGIGKALINKIKEWCIEKNIFTLRLRTNTKRTEAHRFYQATGFSEIKEQKIFELTI